MSNYHAVIMAGGGGTRLWPLSRQDRPKQSLPLLGDRTMFQIAVQRLAPLFTPDRIWVVTGERYAADFRAQCPEIPAENYIIEPSARGTAPAIGLAAQRLQQRDPNAILACLTADHFIGDEARFRAVLAAAAEVAAQNYLVTLGIAPTFASTGFGYIQQGEALGAFGGFATYRAARFREKPALPDAEAMLADGRHAWNSGMFIWRVEQFLAEAQRQLPALFAVLQAPAEQLPSVWATAPNTTLDYGIMEGAARVAVIPAAGLNWNDIGSWDALFDVLPSDAAGNVTVGGQPLTLHTRRSLIHAQGQTRRIVTLGVENLVVVDTGDVLFICPRDQAQNVRQVVDWLKQRPEEKGYL
jgi:mannose-1-phosphate guanylyltransferase